MCVYRHKRKWLQHPNMVILSTVLKLEGLFVLGSTGSLLFLQVTKLPPNLVATIPCSSQHCDNPRFTMCRGQSYLAVCFIL